MSDSSTTQSVPLVTVTLDTVIGETYDREIEDTRPVTIGERIVEAATAKLLKDIGGDLRKQVQAAVSEQIVTQAEKVIAEALSRPFRKTNTWGDATGPETTVAALIGEQVEAWLNQANSYDRQSPFRKLLAELVDKAMRNDLAEKIKKARAEADKAVRDKLADLLADAVKSAKYL